MSVQFGRWNFEGPAPAPDYIEKVNAILSPYGPDSNESYSKDGLKILYRAFHTTKESHREKQPHICPSGAVITWDGRLDNRADLISELRDSLTVNSTDVAIVAAAFERWGNDCFAKLIGDWALSIWNPKNRWLLLAKDLVGVKHLYYAFEKDWLTWSTILDPLVLFAGKTLSICEEYIAGWLSDFPAAHLTPYLGIHAVPPSSFVLLRPGKHGSKHAITEYWDFDPSKRIRYDTDPEYEEHFRTVFATAVQRRLRSDRPVLAELSGGMDSSSIVCIADTVSARGAAETPHLDTLSVYDDSDPNWNERPYFTKVEEKRGRTGFHIDLDAQRQRDVGSWRLLTSEFESDPFKPIPALSDCHSEVAKQYATYVMSQGNRVTLSGVGGDVLTGSVPTPIPELQDLLARARFFALVRQLKVWSAKSKQRTPRLHLLSETIRGFLPLTLVGMLNDICPAPWFHVSFVRRNRNALRGYSSRLKLFGPLPSFQDQIGELNFMRRLMGCRLLQAEPHWEVRYPYFDRDLLEFMYAIPREQLVRPGQRRSLMRRALVGIVPEELLNRRHQHFVQRDPTTGASRVWPSLVEIGQHIVSSSIGIIDLDRSLQALQQARCKEAIPIGPMTRTLRLESWLRQLTLRGVLMSSTKRQEHSSSLEAEELQAPAPHNGLAS